MKLGIRTLMLSCLLALTLPLMTACIDTTNGLAGVGQSFTTLDEAQITTYSQATRAATLATKTVDLVVQTGKLDRPTLLRITQLNDTLHAAWVVIRDANARGESLNFASFRAALAGFETFRKQQGIPLAKE